MCADTQVAMCIKYTFIKIHALTTNSYKFPPTYNIIRAAAPLSISIRVYFISWLLHKAQSKCKPATHTVRRTSRHPSTLKVPVSFASLFAFWPGEKCHFREKTSLVGSGRRESLPISSLAGIRQAILAWRSPLRVSQTAVLAAHLQLWQKACKANFVLCEFNIELLSSWSFYKYTKVAIVFVKFRSITGE